MRHTACHFRKMRSCGIGNLNAPPCPFFAHLRTVSRNAYRLSSECSATQQLSVIIVAYFFIVAFGEDSSSSPVVKMQSSFKCILPFLFMISAIALSIPSSLSLTRPKPDTLSLPLSLINLNSTGLNLSNLTSNRRIKCNSRWGQDLEIGSCRNAWQKIQPTQHAQRFMPRPNQFHPDIRPGDVLTPFRYLSDDGLCAIVRSPLSTSPSFFFSYSLCAISNKWPRKFTLKNKS